MNSYHTSRILSLAGLWRPWALSAMGWEQTCAKRPGASSSQKMIDRDPYEGRSSAPSATMLKASFQGESTAAMLDKRRDEQGWHNWSTPRHVGVAFLCILGLWIFCFGTSAIMIEALLRITN